MRISVITPTRGRLSLRQTLASINEQLEPGDEHIVIGDGPQVNARRMCLEYGAEYHQGACTASWGNAQRDLGISIAQGDYLAFCDDDDVFVYGALATVRFAIADNPGKPFMFKMRVPNGGVLWRKRGNLGHAEIGTPMFVCPNDKGKMGTWATSQDKYAADHWFITNTLSHYHPSDLIWREEVICLCRNA